MLCSIYVYVYVHAIDKGGRHSNEYAYSSGACEYLNQLTYAGIYRIHYVLSVCI